MVANAPEINVATATAEAPAKLNLTLEVVGPRPDGFHDIRSIVMGISLCDRVSARLRADHRLELSCSDSSLSNDDNLAVRAARSLQRDSAAASGLTIELDKHIPVGGGLGGGSSDAAATLRICNVLWSLGLRDDELAARGAELGSDVPLFFSLPSALITGRGEVVTPVTFDWSGWAVLVLVAEPVSTSAAYQAWSAGARARDADREHEALPGATTAEDIMAGAFNDLERAVLSIAPGVERAFHQIETLGLGTFRISGAGSTFYQLHDNEQAAGRVAQAITEADIGVTTAVVAAPAGIGPIRSEE